MIVNRFQGCEGEEDHRLPGVHTRQSLCNDGTQAIEQETLHRVIVQ
jgi:hypothetical protein